MGPHSVEILLQIFLMFAAAKVLGAVGGRVQVPVVISEIVAGILIGPHLLALVSVEGWTMALAELGAIVLLFDVGLEQKLSDIMRVGWTALLVAVSGVVIPFLLGYGLLALMDYGTPEAIFMGTAMVATSVGITARVLQELGVIKTVVATVILGAAVVDDILGMITLAVASSLSEGIDYLEIGTVAGLAVAFTLLVIVAGRRLARRVMPRVQRFVPGDPSFALAMVVCLGLAVAAAKIEIAAIIGAFLAGLVFSEEEIAADLKENVHSLYEFLVPFFFVTLGMQMDVAVLGQRSVLLLAALVTVLAVLGKLVGCGLGAYKLGWKPAVQVGMGMVPRGEVGLIVASIGLGMEIIHADTYAVVIIMVLVTTLIAPPGLKAVFAGRGPSPGIGPASAAGPPPSHPPP